MDALVNENIEAERVLVIDADGTALGEMQIDEAINKARTNNYDLVCVAPNAKVPVCRFMDYSKYRYELQKRARESRKNQKVVVLKEIRLSPVIGQKDFETKLKTGKEFLADGSKLKVSIYFPRGKRRLLQFESSTDILDRYVAAMDEYATVETKSALDGRNSHYILVPKNKKKDKE
ncbi:MAG TPA: translation initiation factor IF-3 [Bacilli bacterium]|nr:translation initiation factor IF-3 [Bacilli bacterium]HPL54954.1 translation initiation factor IF-3 [Bacilli bacterium]